MAASTVVGAVIPVTASLRSADHSSRGHAPNTAPTHLDRGSVSSVSRRSPPNGDDGRALELSSEAKNDGGSCHLIAEEHMCPATAEEVGDPGSPGQNSRSSWPVLKTKEVVAQWTSISTWSLSYLQKKTPPHQDKTVCVEKAIQTPTDRSGRGFGKKGRIPTP